MTKNETVFSKDLQQKKLHVTRNFDAPLEQVWRAWTEARILDQWWAPQPYRAETKSMDFREGGYWLYCMIGPEGDRTWCRVNWDVIRTGEHISYRNMFCDEAGNPNPDFPPMYWQQDFKAEQDKTTVVIEIRFDRIEDMEMIIGMGFQEGFTAGLDNLDHYLANLQQA
jgi:PhnB protein